MREIPLGGKKAAGRSALVSDEDYEYLSQFKWYMSYGYVVRTHYPGFWRDGHYRVHMHRDIMGFERHDPRQVDHINMNRIDNRRENLREATNALNRQNQVSNRGASSIYRGVDYLKEKDMWRAQVGHQGRNFHLGNFDNELDAARAAQEVRLKLMPFTVEKEIYVGSQSA